MRLTSFKSLQGTIVADKYEVLDLLGSGWESEVYRLRECTTGIEMAGKFFFPHRNRSNRALKYYAKKLYKLRDCQILIQYLTQDWFEIDEEPIYFLVSEFVEGELLSDFIKRQKGGRLGAFQAIHLLYSMVDGIDQVHQRNEYHGDLHAENIIIRRHGLGFDLKLIDMYSWGSQKRENIRNDIVDLVRIFYDSVGGQQWYSRQPDEVKDICCGLKQSLILKKFRTAAKLKSHLERMVWS